MPDKVATECREEADFLDDPGCCPHCGVELKSNTALAALLRRAANRIDALVTVRGRLLNKKLPRPKDLGSRYD